MPPKKEAPVTRRSSTRPASAKQATSPKAGKGASAAKKSKVADVVKDDGELQSPRRRVASSKNAKPADGKGKPEEGKVVGAPSPARKRGRAANDKEKRSDEVGSPEPKKRKKVVKQVKEDVVEYDGSLVSLPSASNHLTRTIIIEACTQCRSFKERADKVKQGLENAIPGISVEINPQKPRRGYFEIREEKTEVILSLPSMNRPFKLMKQLNMDELVKDLIKRFQ
ncbi:hypothetical protein KFK09_014433 [Dendrobium nobile]|uniref:Selenoprotein H n=1 Tax=Dendrobium nobile TaxID=94219 RepID=A0A8T3B3V7_DENNO|nr:hypothetical protein KFK09_014433 [Dendrobium nobile]